MALINAKFCVNTAQTTTRNRTETLLRGGAEWMAHISRLNYDHARSDGAAIANNAPGSTATISDDDDDGDDAIGIPI